ncbi:MAG: sigma-70 family RNA polymerase sigma factor [Candidatus Krumholzibacteriota bacterium]|nr:sigma-70 family RNA polymerase sigma factor [Candidatus Krumholzibacteriota bacterium]
MPVDDTDYQGIDIEEESKTLARDFLAGDTDAFNRLIILHQKLVFSLCLRLLGDYDDADDCAQEVFLKIHRYLKGFRFESSFRTWLYRVTVNTCKNLMDSSEYRMKRKKVRIEEEYRSEEEGERVIKDSSPSPLALLGRKELGRMLDDALETLPAAQRLVVVLKDVEGASYEQITEITGMKTGTVKSKLSRARLKLRKVIKGMINDEMS